MNYKGTAKDCPCSNCEIDRDDECHCRCEKYRDWKQARAEMAENVNRVKDIEQSLTEYDIAKSKRIYMNPIRYIRCINTPVCEKCKYCKRYFGDRYCTSEKYLEHRNKVKATCYERAALTLVRGTRFCAFEQKED